MATFVMRDSLCSLDLPTRAGVHGLALLIIFASGLVDLPGSVSVGPISIQGLLTVGYFCSGLLLLPVLSPIGFPAGSRLALSIFVLWAATSLIWTTALANGIQNVLVIATLLVLLVAADASAAVEPRFAYWVTKQVGRSVLMATLLYGLSVLWCGPGTNDLIGARSFGLFALLGVAHCLSQWRYGRFSGLLGGVLLTFLIGVSQSRLALGIAIAMFPMSQIPTKRMGRFFKMIGVSFAVAIASYGAFQYFDALRERFLTGDTSLKIGNVGINVSGRTAYWRVTMDSLTESPVIGKGAGSAGHLIESTYLDIRHPHSDYVRIAHDYGAVGIILWTVSVVVLLFSLGSAWRQADILGNSSARLHLTALLSFIAFVLAMSMENVMVYTFVTAPLAVIVGSAFGIHRAGKRLAHPCNT